MRRIVLTGGSGAGKTVISNDVTAHFADRLVHVPEAATAVYTRLGRRRDELTPAERRAVQRDIYALQLRQEADVAAAYPGRVMLLDRGTLDGACYWPDGADDYWDNMGTTPEAELARYDAVLWLESAAAVGLYDKDSNKFRCEGPEVALVDGKRIKDIWAGHPRFVTVSATLDLSHKRAAVFDHVARLLAEIK